MTNETSKVDWAQLLLDDQTDDMIITVSREKIAHELIRLRNENSELRAGNIGTPSQISQHSSAYQRSADKNGSAAPFGINR